jgi:threonine dehydratase
MRTEIEDASTRLANYVRKTPVISFGSGAWRLDAHLVLKLEQLQHTGSFLPGRFLSWIPCWWQWGEEA